MKEWMNERMNEWINEWMNQRMNQCITFDFFTNIKSGIFSTKCEMTNLILIYKCDFKQNVKYYRLFFLLLTLFGKIFERLVYNEMYSFFIKNDYFQINQVLNKWDYFVNQLLSITHDIYQSLDQFLELRGVLLDILKEFEEVSPQSWIKDK